MPFEPCRYLRYKELFTPELVATSGDGSDIPAVANTWCNLTLKEVGLDDFPVSMIACSRPGRICYRSYLEQRSDASSPIAEEGGPSGPAPAIRPELLPFTERTRSHPG